MSTCPGMAKHLGSIPRRKRPFLDSTPPDHWHFNKNEQGFGAELSKNQVSFILETYPQSGVSLGWGLVLLSDMCETLGSVPRKA